ADRDVRHPLRGREELPGTGPGGDRAAADRGGRRAGGGGGVAGRRWERGVAMATERPGKKTRLGKGLGALLGEYLPEEEPREAAGYRVVPVARIAANPFQ